MGVAVQVRAEEDAFVGHLAQAVEREDLKPARVGQDSARPGHELVEPAQGADQLMPGAKEQVVSVGEDDAGADLVEQVLLRHALDARLCADRHEHRSFDDPVRGVEQPGARLGLRALGKDFEGQLRLLRTRLASNIR